MKKIYFACLVMFFLVACHGTNDGSEVEQGDYVEPFVLSVDKDEIEADGFDKVTFSLSDATGRDILKDMVAMQRVNIYDKSSEARVERLQSVFVSIENAQYEFEATYGGVKSSNTVQLVSKNRGAYEKFHKNVALFKCTSVYCTACPVLTENIGKVDDSSKEHLVVLACHGDYGGADPFSVYIDQVALGGYIMGRFESSSWPTVIYDMVQMEKGAARVSAIEDRIWDRRVNHPATCGIKVSSAVNAAALTVDATLCSSTGGSYSLCCAVLRDGLEDNGEIYNDVVVNIAPNFMSYTNATLHNVAKDREVTESFRFEFDGSVPSENELASYRIVVFAHRKIEGSSQVDNVVSVPYGVSSDYRLNN